MPRYQGRGDVAYRLAYLTRQLAGRAVLTPEQRRDLARDLDVNQRTVMRDLEALEQAGWILPAWKCAVGTSEVER